MSNSELMKPKQSSISTLSSSLQIKEGVMISTIKSQCFKGVSPDKVTNEQLAAYVSVANSLKQKCPMFNPLLTGFLYAYPTKNGGIEPMIGPDGVYCLLENHSNVKGWDVEFEHSDKGEPVSATAKIFLRDSDIPRKKTVFMEEWHVATNSNWKQRPRHMLELRALKQCARMVIHGLPFDEQDREIQSLAEKQNTPLPKDNAQLLKEAVKSQEEPQEQSEPQDNEQAKEASEVPTKGREAYKAGFSIEDNPFEPASTKGKGWVAGFEMEKEEHEAEIEKQVQEQEEGLFGQEAEA